ncbi:M28 family peptidase [Kriegella aquimaris]|uniref:PA domain-containing protein n=1 Tax=Kriegella aquimaris TaxID=192904 RepID=A0A1G9J420_9FLAO|nr:M28 family peptidase [Kriegella aquimaris]SDL32240.1 PA domain-containing protein [Kriegella aquimaris]
MKKFIIVITGFFIACNSSQKTVSEPLNSQKTEVSSIKYAESITEAELKEHLYTYASDEFEGRETGQPGQKKAIEYLKAYYQKLGIPAAKKNGDYFQDVPLELSKLPSGSVDVNGKDYPIGEHILTFSAAEGNYKEIVYAGYGIEQGEYSDYKNLDVSGKIVLVKYGEPINTDGNFTLSGTSEKSIWSNMSESIGKRMELASEKGAKGIIFFDLANFGRFKNRFEVMKRNDRGRMVLKTNKEDEFVSFFADAIFAKEILPTIEKDQKPRRIDLSLNLKVTSSNDEIASENVIAFLEGSEKPDEYVIISSHLDHIGVNSDGQINNGADDDGSGTVATLSIAKAFKMASDAGHGPKRSVVFLHVTGEEKGLLGSQYYADVEPIFPLEKTVADLNIDMIGRIDPKRDGDRNYIYLIGSDKLSTELHELSEDVNKKYANLELDYTYNDVNDPNRFYYRSDHYNFAKNNIPIIFYFNGTHADYHKPGDTPDKINYDLLQNRTRLIFYTAWEIANRDTRLVVDKATK